MTAGEESGPEGKHWIVAERRESEVLIVRVEMGDVDLIFQGECESRIPRPVVDLLL